MLVNVLKKNLDIIYMNINIFNFIKFFIISDLYLHFYLNNKQNFLIFIKFLKYSSFFNLDLLLDIKCDDICFFSKKYRFKLTYVFLSIYYNTRIFITVFLHEHESLFSLEKLFKSASFLEREVWDEFGVNFYFKNKKSNRRLLTDYGFKGHPLKKNYPLTGFYECIYYLEKYRIKNIPISLLQEYRKFAFRNYIL